MHIFLATRCAEKRHLKKQYIFYIVDKGEEERERERKRGANKRELLYRDKD